MSSTFVVGLSGPPGAGKTTLASLVQRRRPGTRLISVDKYQLLTRLTQTQVRNWFGRGADLNEIDHREIVAELTHAISSEPGRTRPQLLLFETPFGRLHRETGAFIDFLVWIDTPLDLALARAILAFTGNVQRDRAPHAAREFVDWQFQYISFYPTAREMYLAQRQHVAPTADLVIDGSLPSDAWIEAFERSLAPLGVVL